MSNKKGLYFWNVVVGPKEFKRIHCWKILFYFFFIVLHFCYKTTNGKFNTFLVTFFFHSLGKTNICSYHQ